LIAANKQASHGLRQRAFAGSYGEMNMIVHQAPGIDKGLAIAAALFEPFDNIQPISVIAKDLPPFYPAKSNVVQNTRRVYSRSSRHEIWIGLIGSLVKLIKLTTSPISPISWFP